MSETGNSTQDDTARFLTEEEITNLRDKSQYDLFSEEEIAATVSDEADSLSDEDKRLLDEQLRQIESSLQSQEEDEPAPPYRHTIGGSTPNTTSTSRHPSTTRNSLTSRSQSLALTKQSRLAAFKSYVLKAPTKTWELFIRNSEYARQMSRFKTAYRVLAKEHERTKREFSDSQQVKKDLQNEIQAERILVNEQLRALQQQLQTQFTEACHHVDGDASLKTKGIRFAPAGVETIIDHAHLAEHMQEQHVRLDSLTSIIAQSDLIRTAATLTVDYIHQYLCHLIEKHDRGIIAVSPLDDTIDISTCTLTGINTADDLTPELIDAYVDQHFKQQLWEQWLCTATDVKNSIPTITLGQLQLNQDQQAHLTQLLQAFIRSKMPSQLLMVCEKHIGDRLELPITDVCQQHSQHMAEAIHTAISKRSETSRFRKLMEDRLPQSIGMITIEGEIHTLIANLVTEYTINYINIILEDKTDELNCIDFNRLRRDLPNTLIGSSQINSDVFSKEFGIPDLQIKKVFNTNQRNHILILLQTVQPNLSPTSSSQDIEALATKIPRVMNTTVLKKHNISQRCRDAMKGLPTEIRALQHVKQAQQRVQSQQQSDVTLYDPKFTSALQEKQLQQWWQENILTIQDEEQRQAYIDQLIATKWLTKNQTLALSEHMPIFANGSQKTKLENIREKFYKLKSLHLPEEGITKQQITKLNSFCKSCSSSKTAEVKLAFTTSQGQGRNVLERITTLRHKRTQLHQAQQRTVAAHSKLKETEKKMRDLIKMAVMWKNLALASAHQYVLKSTSSFHGSEGRERAACVINSLINTRDDHREIFQTLMTLLNSHMVTFNGGSLGSYMLQGLSTMTTDKSTKEALSDTKTKHDKLTTINGHTTSIAGLATQLKEKEALTAETIQSRLGNSSMFSRGRPTGKTSLKELIFNSSQLREWCGTSNYKTKQRQAKSLQNQLLALTRRAG